MSEFSSNGKTQDTWKSPRKIDEEIRLYQRKRFEDYMSMADIGLISREMAIRAMRNEVEIDPELTLPWPPEERVEDEQPDNGAL